MGDWGGRAPPIAPDSKRRRFGTPPRKPPPRPPPIAVRFSGVPSEYTQETFEELHEAFGLGPGVLKSCEFILGSGKQVPAVDVVITYTDASTAKQAHDALKDQPVENFEGQVFNLKAKLVQNDPREARVAGGATPAGARSRAPPKDEPERIYPSVYLSDVPVEYTEDVIREMHTSFGLDADKIMGLKMLPSQGVSFETTSCIMRYADQDAAEAAVQTLRGQAVELPTGEVKRLGARMAKPARWMVEKGLASDDQDPEAGVEQPMPPLVEERVSKFKDSMDECGEGMHCVGKAGMLLFEDTESGRAFCEACFDAWESRTGLSAQPGVKQEVADPWAW